MKKRGLPPLVCLALCLALSACAAPAANGTENVLTAGGARAALAQRLLETEDEFLSYDPETGFDAGEYHYVWSDKFWPDGILESSAEGTEIYCFDLVYGPDTDEGRPEDLGNPMAGRLLMSFGAGKDGGSFWRYRQDLGRWETLSEG